MTMGKKREKEFAELCSDAETLRDRVSDSNSDICGIVTAATEGTMKKTNMTGKTCVGDIRLSSLDVGYDLRRHGYKVHVPDDCTSAGYDVDGVTWLIEGTAEEIRAELLRAGYKVLDRERINRLE